MSVSLGCYGVMEPTEEYLAKYEAYMACRKANVSMPPELIEYFDGINPSSDGMEVLIQLQEGFNGYAVSKEIDLTKLRKGITKIRIYLS